MFGRATKYQDIEKMDLLFDDSSDKEPLQIYFPFKQKDPSGLDNAYQTSRMGDNGHLYIVIDADATVDDEYPA